MTPRQAHDLVRSIEALWKIDFGSEGRELWSAAFLKYESVEASQAAIQLSQRQRERPTIADMRNMILKVKRDKLPNPTVASSPLSKDIPAWVKRWCCARYLHAQFNRAKDLRRFPEMGEWADPTTPLMPAGEWDAEASGITSNDVWRAVGVRQ